MATYSAIGFIGLGNMGVPMLHNLLKRTEETVKFYIFDLNKVVLKEQCTLNPGRVLEASNPKNVAENCQIIISMVPEGSHVRSVYLSPDAGVLEADVSGKILIDCSTIDTATSLAVRAEILKRYPSAYFVDAPVSGGVLGAEKATLTFMLGTSEDDAKLPLLQDLLGKLGGNIVACGGPSLGLAAKLCNNYCAGLITLAVCESMNIGMLSGLDPRKLASIFNSSTAQSAICDKWCPVPGLCPEAPASNGYKGGFKIQLLQKDFGLALATAKQVGANLRLGNEAMKVYTETMHDPKCRDLDSRVVYRYLDGDEDWASKHDQKREA